MRIFDQDLDKTSKNIILYLTNSEAAELLGDLQTLIQKPHNNHAHISNSEYTKEITICIYDPKNLNEFDERSKKVIVHDE